MTTPPPLTLGQVLKKSQDWLRQRGVDSPRLDAELLAAHALGITERVRLYLELERPLTADEATAIRALVQRRGAREPVAWITGRRGFHELDLAVHKDVLVPRPDTETLVEALLARIPVDAELLVADLGCGTGAIGLALAVARPGIKVYAVDLSEAALENTRANVAALGLGARVAVLRGDLLDAVPTHRAVDLVVSNPPYIPTAALATLQPEVRTHEPRLALDGGADGLDVYRRLLPAAARRARLGVAVEIGHDQGPAVAALARQAGLQEVRVLRDLGHRDRVVLGTVPGARWPTEPPPPPEGEARVEPLPVAGGEPPPAALDPDPEAEALPVWDADR
ncbi:peptide chain release factor N(5)-glutamine methyltransferase [Myxococcota bacterium]|nr:peptide chain release factor N(5)-glutamine methyltransferase [Myxococcota bacterium]